MLYSVKIGVSQINEVKISENPYTSVAILRWGVNKFEKIKKKIKTYTII